MTADFYPLSISTRTNQFNQLVLLDIECLRLSFKLFDSMLMAQIKTIETIQPAKQVEPV